MSDKERLEGVDEMRAIERSLAYDGATCNVECNCVMVEQDGEDGAIWLDINSAKCDLMDELRYLVHRGAIERHPTNAAMIRLLDEDELVDEEAVPIRSVNERVGVAERTYCWLQDTLRGMVDDEAALLFASELAAGGIVFKVLCAPQDVGKLIGKQGHNVQALRTMLAARAKKDDVSYSLNIDQNGKGTR